MRSGMITWGRNFLILGSATLTVVGCGGSDLSGYRPLDKSSVESSSSTATDNAPPESQQVANQIAATSTDADTASASNGQSISEASESPEVNLPASALRPVNVVDGASVANLLKTVPAETASTTSANPIQPASATVTPDKPRTVELLIPEKTFARDARSKSLRVSYDDLDLLKVLNLDPVTENAVELMPDWLKGLNGERVKIRGFMFPTFVAEGLDRFVLARDNQICCFGRDPKVYDLVQVDMRSGKTTNYIPPTRAFDVIGRFKIEMVSVDGKPYGLYSIEDAEIIDR